MMRKGGKKQQQNGKKRRKGKSWKDLEYEGADDEAAVPEPKKRGHRPTQKRAAALSRVLRGCNDSAWTSTCCRGRQSVCSKSPSATPADDVLPLQLPLLQLRPNEGGVEASSVA